MVGLGMFTVSLNFITTAKNHESEHNL